jgi:DNA repair protein RadC
MPKRSAIPLSVRRALVRYGSIHHAAENDELAREWLSEITDALRVRAKGLTLLAAEDVFSVLRGSTLVANRETLHVFGFDSSCVVLVHEELYRGLADQITVRVSELLRPVLIAQCSQWLIAHNHPTGSVEPSTEDATLTRRCIAASKYLNINFADHLIVSSEGWFSFYENRPEYWKLRPAVYPED